MRRYGLLFLWMLCSLAALGYAESPHELFFSANKHYANGSYEEAAHEYEAMLEKGIKSGNVYYNLGNAYFKLGRKGKAVVNYLRAEKEMQHDGDVFTNLNFVTSLLEEAQVEEVRPWYERIFSAVRDVFSPGTWFVLSAILFFMVCLAAGLCIFRPDFKTVVVMIAIFLGFLWLVCLGFHLSSAAHERNSRLAVITEPKVEVRYSPSYSGAVAFELFEGMKVKELRNEKDWRQIRLTKEKSGWVPAGTVEKV